MINGSTCVFSVIASVSDNILVRARIVSSVSDTDSVSFNILMINRSMFVFSAIASVSVSYTHLTLPTIYSV